MCNSTNKPIENIDNYQIVFRCSCIGKISVMRSLTNTTVVVNIHLLIRLVGYMLTCRIKPCELYFPIIDCMHIMFWTFFSSLFHVIPCSSSQLLYLALWRLVFESSLIADFASSSAMQMTEWISGVVSAAPRPVRPGAHGPFPSDNGSWVLMRC